MELLVLNEEFKTVDTMDTFESIIWTDRYSQYGDFQIYTSTTQKIINNIKQNYYIWSEHSDHVMIVENRKMETDVENGNHITISGRSLESLLDRRIVWVQTNLNSYFETAIKRLLNENVINPSDPKRKIPNFIYEDSGDSYIESLQIEAQFTGDSLYSAIKSLCDSVNIGFKITLNDQNQFVFKLYSGTNRSYDQNINPYVVFSPSFENIINSKYYESTNLLKNVTLVAGEGEGFARKTVTVGDQQSSGLSRRELFTDARDISSSTSTGDLTTSQYNYLLSQRGYEKLAENKDIQSFDGQVETTQMYQYGKDFFMGDITQLENEYGMESKVRVIEYIYSEDKKGVEQYPTFEVIEKEEVA